MKGKPIILKSPWMRKGYCLNLFGILCARDTSWIDIYVINHERIHTAQMRELLFIPFYILYGVEWLFRLIQYRDPHKAYLNISFEREAYRHGHDLGYLKRRQRYASFRKGSR
ncbi:MAG: hypothetical protein K2N48_02580 [Muribaculaceae bacterium]|nr:hypothetical protein [Muribaculaceae bacterium]